MTLPQNRHVVLCDAQQQQAEEREAHADRQRKRLRLAVGEVAIAGCNNDAVNWNASVITPICAKSSA